MAANFIEANELDVYTFACDTVADLDLLPTTTSWGKGPDLLNMDPIRMGSFAIVAENSSVYMLKSDDTWEKL